MAESYVLDTNILLLLARGKDRGQAVITRYGLLVPGLRPLVSVVSHGELWALARRNNWDETKRSFVRRNILDNVVTVELSQSVDRRYRACGERHADHD